MAVIYKATNKLNGKSYVGFSTNYKRRKHNHEKRECGEYFHNALKKHGKENFEWTILKENATLEDEVQFIEEHQTFWEYGKGYNLTKGGEGSLGRIISEQTREKHRNNTKEKMKDENHRKSISEKTKVGMEIWWNSLSEEEKQDYKNRCSKRPNGWKQKSGYKLKPHTEEAKKKIGNAHRGKVVSEETKRKMKENRNPAYGNRNSMAKEENRKKVSLSKLGRKRVYMPDGSFKYMFPSEIGA